MSHATLREIAKIGSGIVIGDIVSVLSFHGIGILPLSVLGVHWSVTMLPEILAFDIALLLVLVHFGWNMKLPVQSPSERTLLWIAGIIFLAVALGHLAQLALNTHVFLGDFQLPTWLSWVGIVITAYLSYSCFHFAKHMRGR